MPTITNEVASLFCVYEDATKFTLDNVYHLLTSSDCIGLLNAINELKPSPCVTMHRRLKSELV